MLNLLNWGSILALAPRAVSCLEYGGSTLQLLLILMYSTALTGPKQGFLKSISGQGNGRAWISALAHLFSFMVLGVQLLECCPVQPTHLTSLVLRSYFQGELLELSSIRFENRCC